MKHTAFITVLSGFAYRTHANYCFPRLIVNDTVSQAFRFIRDPTNSRHGAPMLSSLPIRSPDAAGIVCGNSPFGPNVGFAGIETATVLAGTSVGFMISERWTEFDDDPYIWYKGPGQVFLSRSPNSVPLDAYDGSGEWFKIGYVGPANETTWSTYGETSINVTIPKATLAGKYLMRLEQLIPNADLGKARWYVACAQIEIVGSGTGK